MTGLIADVLSLAVILYMGLVLVAGVVMIPAAFVALVGRVAGVW